MCLKIRCDGKSWKVFGFWAEVNKSVVYFVVQRNHKDRNLQRGRCYKNLQSRSILRHPAGKFLRRVRLAGSAAHHQFPPRTPMPSPPWKRRPWEKRAGDMRFRRRVALVTPHAPRRQRRRLSSSGRRGRCWAGMGRMAGRRAPSSEPRASQRPGRQVLHWQLGGQCGCVVCRVWR